LASNFTAFVIGVTVNTHLIREYVFLDPKYRFIKDITLSILTGSIIFGLGMILIFIFVEYFMINVYVSKIIANGLTFIINLIIRKFFF